MSKMDITKDLKEMIGQDLNETILSLLNDTTDNEEIYRPLTEMESFLALDPVLASLTKQLEEVKDQYNAIVSQFGENDDMAKIAQDTVESTQSAIDTRTLELRKETETGGQMGEMIQALNNDIAAEEEKAKEERYKKQQNGFKEQRQRMEKVMATNEYNSMHLLALMFWQMIMMEDMPWKQELKNNYTGLFNKVKNRNKFECAFEQASGWHYTAA